MAGRGGPDVEPLSALRRSRRPGRRPTSARAATARPSRRPAVPARVRSAARPTASRAAARRPRRGRSARTRAGWVTTIAPARTHTGIACSGAGAATSRPPRTRSPDHASIHSPGGSHASRSRAPSSTTGATHSAGPDPERVGHLPAARVQQRGRADDRRATARGARRRGAQVRVEHLVQEHVAAVELERLAVVGPRLLLEPAVRLHERREGAELDPAQQQLLRAALDQAVAEVAADVVRPVREAAAGSRDARRHERAQRPEVRRLVAGPQHAGGLLAAPAAATEEHAAPGAVGVVERAAASSGGTGRRSATRSARPSCRRRSAGPRRRSSPRRRRP